MKIVLEIKCYNSECKHKEPYLEVIRSEEIRLNDIRLFFCPYCGKLNAVDITKDVWKDIFPETSNSLTENSRKLAEIINKNLFNSNPKESVSRYPTFMNP